jgi:hypothetical protein
MIVCSSTSGSLSELTVRDLSQATFTILSHGADLINTLLSTSLNGLYGNNVVSMAKHTFQEQTQRAKRKIEKRKIGRWSLW